MKKLAIATVALIGLGYLAMAGSAALAQTPSNPCQGITIKDPAEYNAYTNAISQSTPQAKAQAIEGFLRQYPNSVVKVDLLNTLMAIDQSISTQATLDAAKQLNAADPTNLRALFVIVYLEHQQANGNVQQLDQAAVDAQKGLSAPKGQCTSEADYEKAKDLVTPTFYSAIGADDFAKKDYAGAIQAYTKELQSYKNPEQTTTMPAPIDTYYLGESYLNQNPRDLKNAIWFLIRAAQFYPQAKSQIESAAEYWYKKYHCSVTDATCINGNPPPGFSDIEQLAAVPANVFPTAAYNPTPAPPPPSPADLAHQAIVNTAGCAGVTPAPPPAAPANGAAAGTAAPAQGATTTPAPATAPASFPAACTDALKRTLGLSDEEFILANGDGQDQQLIWSIMNGVTAQVPGVVVSAASDGTSVQVAVSQDAQQSNTADFTINMKPALKGKQIPAAGVKETYIATFDSYTQKPLMIIMKDGTPPAPAHHTPVRRHHTR
jgi:tetratricopeptide (TPR) repeat protein